MGMNFDIYSITKLVEGGIPHQLELVENAITKLGSDLEPLTVYERHVFVANRQNGEFWRINYEVNEGLVRLHDPVSLVVESDSERFEREQKKVVHSIVEALSDNNQEEVDKLKAQWIKVQRDQYQLESKLNMRVGIRSRYVTNARQAVSEAVNTTRGAKSIMSKGINNSTFAKLVKEGEVVIDPKAIKLEEAPKSRKTLLYQKIVEGRQAALSLNESPVFSEYLKNLYQDVDADEATEFIAENYQELYTLSIKEQTELFYDTLEKQGIKPDVEDVVESVLEIGRYAIGHPEIRPQLEKLTAIVEAESGNFHERIVLIEDEINKRHFTNNDINVLKGVIQKVLESPSEFLAPEFLVELKKAYRRLEEMSDNGSYDDACIASCIHLLSNFYPTQMTLGESKKKESELRKEYDEFFEKKLEKFGVSSPAELDDEKKKEFFDEINKEWKEGEGEKGKKKENLGDPLSDTQQNAGDGDSTEMPQGGKKRKKKEGDFIDDEDPNAEKNIYAESEACSNCGSPRCLCQGLYEDDEVDIIRDEDGGDDEDTSAEQELAIETLKKKFKEMDDEAKAGDWEELHKSVKAAKKKAKGKEMEELEAMDDDIAMKKAKA